MIYRNSLAFVLLLALASVLGVWLIFWAAKEQSFSRTCKLILPTFKEQVAEINTEKSIHKVHKNFLSVSFDNRLLQEHWANFNFTSSRLFTLGRGLSPAYLRIGGTTEDWLLFQPGQNGDQDVIPTSKTPPHFQRGNFTEYNITSADIDKIHYIASKAGWKVLFGLNVCLRGPDGSWNSSNPLQIIKYVARKKYDFGWELGNEPDLLGRFGKYIEPKVLGKDFVTLRNILNKNPEYGSFMLGPDLTRPKNKSMEFLKQFLSVAVSAVDAVTWHQYYFNSRTCKLSDFYDPEILDYLLHQLQLLNSVLQDCAPNKRHWLGETATAWGGGKFGMSNKYVAVFTWLDKLGLAARLGAEVVVKQTFFHGNYALIDDDLNPTPNYWLSLLHKRLVGETVLDVMDSLKEKRIIRIYAHCTKASDPSRYPKGAVTVIVINISPSQDALVSLSGSLRDAGHVEQYLMTAENGNLTSQLVLLNGARLEMTDDDTLPAFHSVTMNTRRPLHVPPLALGFFVIPQANARACI